MHRILKINCSGANRNYSLISAATENVLVSFDAKRQGLYISNIHGARKPTQKSWKSKFFGKQRRILMFLTFNPTFLNYKNLLNKSLSPASVVSKWCITFPYYQYFPCYSSKRSRFYQNPDILAFLSILAFLLILKGCNLASIPFWQCSFTDSKDFLIPWL